MGEDLEQVTTVTIFNRSYQLRSGGDAEYLKELARFVDQRMVELSEATPTVDTLKIAILAALNIADDYLSVKTQLEELERDVEESVQRMDRTLQPLLEGDLLDRL